MIVQDFYPDGLYWLLELMKRSISFFIVSSAALTGSYFLKQRWTKWVYFALTMICAFTVIGHLIFDTVRLIRIYRYARLIGSLVDYWSCCLSQVMSCIVLSIPSLILTILSFRKQNRNKTENGKRE
jgi:TctA family transporter